MNVNPLFNMALLKRYHSQRFLPKLILVNNDAKYEVDKIFKHHRHPYNFLYLLRWKGYGLEEDIWVPEGDLEHAQEMLMQYKA